MPLVYQADKKSVLSFNFTYLFLKVDFTPWGITGSIRFSVIMNIYSRVVTRAGLFGTGSGLKLTKISGLVRA